MTSQRRESKIRFKDHNKLDNFIQDSLDKFFFVDPWKELYNNTGIFAKHIISNKSTIPDLIIFNKTFNKNDCFEEAKTDTFNKFPRYRFILRPKIRKEYNPSCTNEKENKKNEEKKSVEKKNDASLKDTEGFSRNLESPKTKKEEPPKSLVINLPTPKKEEEPNFPKFEFVSKPLPPLGTLPKKEEPQHHTNYNEDDDEEPEWGEDDVTEFKNSKVEFQTIPTSLKENAEKTIVDRKKEDVYNNKAFDEEPEEKKEQVFKNNGNGNILDQIESFLLNENEKKKEEKFNPNDFFDKIDDGRGKNLSPRHNQFFQHQQKKGKKFQGQFHNSKYQQQALSQMQKAQFLYHIQQQQQLLANQIQQQQQYAQYLQMLQNQTLNNMQGQNPYMFNFPQINPLVNMNMNMNMNINFPHPLTNNYSSKSNTNTDDDDEDDPMMNDFSTNFNKYNPTVFLENPALIIKKNLTERNWFLMKDNKILGNYTSEELLYLLEEKIRNGDTFENVCVNDYQTDLVFQPKNLYEILKEKVPKLTKKLLKSKMGGDNNNNNVKKPFKPQNVNSGSNPSNFNLPQQYYFANNSEEF